MFITLEGLDGSGKTTQSKLMAERIELLYPRVVQTREPGGTELGNRIRELILSDIPITPVAEYLLFAADRAQHCVEITEHLDLGRVVVCDRYIGSSLVYQGFNGVSEQFMLETFYESGGIVPDLTFWIDVDPIVAKQRAEERGKVSRFDEQSLIRYHELSKRHKRVADRFGWIRIDGNGSEADTHNNIMEALYESDFAVFLEDRGIKP